MACQLFPVSCCQCSFSSSSATSPHHEIACVAVSSPPMVFQRGWLEVGFCQTPADHCEAQLMKGGCRGAWQQRKGKRRSPHALRRSGTCRWSEDERRRRYSRGENQVQRRRRQAKLRRNKGAESQTIRAENPLFLASD